MKKDCNNCFYSGRPLYKYPCCNCVSSCDRPPDKWEAKPMTNADRIRAMSDDELAVFMFSMVDCVSCVNKLMNNGKLVFGNERKTCTDKDYYAMCNGDGRKCEAVCLAWLQQPVEDEDGK